MSLSEVIHSKILIDFQVQNIIFYTSIGVASRFKALRKAASELLWGSSQT